MYYLGFTLFNIQLIGTLNLPHVSPYTCQPQVLWCWGSAIGLVGQHSHGSYSGLKERIIFQKRIIRHPFVKLLNQHYYSSYTSIIRQPVEITIIG